jgi:Flp pilus assembly protein TadG
MRNRERRAASRRRRGARGQTLVEFALVIPIFLTLVVAIAEFAFLLTVRTGITYASQDATQLAAELGNSPDSDIYILQQIEKDVQSPVDKSRILSVSIFWTDLNGTNKGANTYSRSGSIHNAANTVTVPYSQTGSGYPVANRCNIVLATGCASGHTGVDWIGVSITYSYAWITPLPGLIGLSSTGPTLVETNTSRLEPIQ